MKRRDVAGHQGELAPLPAACEGPLLALFGRATAVFRCPLLGVEQTLISCARRSPFDPEADMRPCFDATGGSQSEHVEG